jgi:hypothetical protein
MYGLYTVHVVNYIILILVELSIIFSIHTLWYVIRPPRLYLIGLLIEWSDSTDIQSF